MMAQQTMGFLPVDRQLLDLSIGEAVAMMVRQRYPRDTAKIIARAWNIDAVTAANVVKGHCSERSLTKAIRAEGWSFITALGATITGETFEQAEERRLNTLIAEAELARQNIRSLAARRQTLEARTARAFADLDGPEPHMDRGASGGAGSADLERGPKPPRSRKA
jgi:hypothetical protein